MARLPSGNHTERPVVKFRAASSHEAALAQRAISESGLLTADDKAFAHFWCGYFHAHAIGVNRPVEVRTLGPGEDLGSLLRDLRGES